MMRRATSPGTGFFSEMLLRWRGAVLAVAAFSAAVNILGLTGSFYMLQVYDRVLASRSVETLVALSLLTVGLFALQGFLEIIRGQVTTRIGLSVERDLLKPVHELLIHLPRTGHTPAEATQPMRDIESIRAFVASPGPLALMDLPWSPFYLFVVFLLHPWLGVLSLAGMLVLTALAIVTEQKVKRHSLKLSQAAAKRHEVAESSRRHVEVLKAMGFADRAAQRFYAASGAMLDAHLRIADVSGMLGSTSRTVRTILQSAILGLGAYLVIRGQMSGGSIIAASILSGRALQPVDLTISQWKVFVAARQAQARLAAMLRILPPPSRKHDLPRAGQQVTIEDVAVTAPGSRQPIIRNVRFALKPGDGLAIVGPSGAGKSTLARGLVGAWPLLSGHVRLDGASLDQWPEASLGRMIGYLPQDIELFDGTVAENIARLDPEATDADVIAAAQAANVHAMVLRLPEGYATRLGEGGHNLSVGQRQRIGLARALYGEPFLVVLDEPNAHLDAEGEEALGLALRRIRERGGIVVAVSHRQGILANANLVGVMKDGHLVDFGPRDAVLKKRSENRNVTAAQGNKGPNVQAIRPVSIPWPGGRSLPAASVGQTSPRDPKADS